ncbi:preprotein translocase subunit SecG [Albidovulum sediminicola]|uniref:Protein-export membrane protein SecG n=1 Tax=Albidovulum sediminicola TaxID=2984331 RepID=A0ABT2Z2R8_9RHOB|nr:preprotein translocase subunit SecG [Defluviimonas sp. WL0075]MCV2865440.1 preprotein translocase subunit SecG [Defluviimonas sp. WL0075]
MENVILTVHLILALMLIGVVLLQRSEGGGLLSGGGAMSARGAANALTKLTWALAVAFIATSIALTLVAAQKSEGISVVDQPGTEAPAEAPVTPIVPTGDLLPPASAGDGQAPAADDAPLAPPPAN